MPPDVTAPPPPLREIGRYDLLAKIAEGGMGAVYKGRHKDTGDVVAIKIVPPETAKNPVLVKRFEQEFKAASLLDHPNIVKAIEYCGTGPSPFLAMEFVDGESLGQKLERGGPLPEDEAVRLLAQVCDGLHRAHKQGLIHRDVKPDNILVTPDGVAKLTDLGLVKDVEGELNLTRTGRGLGTPHFMAPEQFRNAKNVDLRGDIYALGATLYMAVTGSVPFARTSPLDCWMRKTKDDFPAPKGLNPAVSDRVDWAVRRAMSADPDRRPASCREFMEDLTGQSWRSGTITTFFPPPAGGSAALWYMVYKDGAGQPKTVKGATASIRGHVKHGTLGDPHLIVVSRAKAGPFQPLRAVPEFRDLVVVPGAAAPPAGRPLPPAPPADTPTAKAALTVPNDPGPPPPLPGTAPARPAPAKKRTDSHAVVPIFRADGTQSAQFRLRADAPSAGRPSPAKLVWAAAALALAVTAAGAYFLVR